MIGHVVKGGTSAPIVALCAALRRPGVTTVLDVGRRRTGEPQEEPAAGERTPTA